MKLKPLKKAFKCKFNWSDDYEGRIIYAENHSKARYKYWIEVESYDHTELLNVRAKRSKENDLYPPILHPMTKNLNEELKNIILHTSGLNYGLIQYRNRYVIDSNNKNANYLVELGIMDKADVSNLMGGSCMFYLTNLGIEIAQSYMPKTI
jgi:hypothetical protein